MRKLITFILVLLPFFTTSVIAAPVHKNQINRVFSCEINIHEIQGVVKDLKYLMGMNN